MFFEDTRRFLYSDRCKHVFIITWGGDGFGAFEITADDAKFDENR